MAITTAKKEKEKKKAKLKQEKAEKMRERKENAKKGKSLEDMLAYVDENGNLSSTPPDPSKKKVIEAKDISLNGIRPEKEEVIRKGILTTFNDSKGYGFILDRDTKESIFVHMNSFLEPIKQNDVVTFEVERSPKGLNAVNVKKLV